MKSYFFLAFALLSGLNGLAHAKFYKWTDKQGNTHYTTTPPPESSQHDRAILDHSGQQRALIRGKLSEQEKQALAREMAEKKAREKAEKAAKKRDRVLLLSYPDLKTLMEKHDEKLKKLDAQIADLEKDWAVNNQQYQKLLKKAMTLERSGKAPDEAMKSNLWGANRSFSNNDDELNRARTRREKSKQLAENDIQRFKELKGI